jgi:hypothetical protein
MPATISGYKYVQSFIDGRTRLKYTYLLKKKSDAGGALRDFIVKFESEHDCLVKSVHADNAAEFTGGDFNSCLREKVHQVYQLCAVFTGIQRTRRKLQ